MKCSLGLSNFLEEISSLSYSIVSLYFFALTTEKSWFTWKDLNAGKYWGQEEKGETEDKMIRWHRWLNGDEFEQLREILKDREVCCATVHGVAESDTTLWLKNNNNLTPKAIRE